MGRGRGSASVGVDGCGRARARMRALDAQTCRRICIPTRVTPHLDGSTAKLRLGSREPLEFIGLARPLPSDDGEGRPDRRVGGVGEAPVGDQVGHGVAQRLGLAGRAITRVLSDGAVVSRAAASSRTRQLETSSARPPAWKKARARPDRPSPPEPSDAWPSPPPVLQADSPIQSAFSRGRAASEAVSRPSSPRPSPRPAGSAPGPAR